MERKAGEEISNFRFEIAEKAKKEDRKRKMQIPRAEGAFGMTILWSRGNERNVYGDVMEFKKRG